LFVFGWVAEWVIVVFWVLAEFDGLLPLFLTLIFFLYSLMLTF
jgi:hypothetical protein